MLLKAHGPPKNWSSEVTAPRIEAYSRKVIEKIFSREHGLPARILVVDYTRVMSIFPVRYTALDGLQALFSEIWRSRYGSRGPCPVIELLRLIDRGYASSPRILSPSTVKTKAMICVSDPFRAPITFTGLEPASTFIYRLSTNYGYPRGCIGFKPAQWDTASIEQLQNALISDPRYKQGVLDVMSGLS